MRRLALSAEATMGKGFRADIRRYANSVKRRYFWWGDPGFRKPCKNKLVS